MEELKIYIDSPDNIEELLTKKGAKFSHESKITDTYFNQPAMVLKLTEDEKGAMLTQLEASNGGFKFIKEERIENKEETKKQLEDQYGIKCVLKKTRRFWTYENYNINLNLFEDIGNFLIVEGEKVTPEMFNELLDISNPKYLTKSFAQLKEELDNKPTVILSDLGGVLLFPKDRNYKGKLNPIYEEESIKENFKFSDHFELNTELLNFYTNLKFKGITFFMITEGKIQDAPEIKQDLENVFTAVYSSNQMGFSKKDPELYKKLAEEIGIELSKTVYIDDDQGNSDAAANAGLKALVYLENSAVMAQVEGIMS